MKISKIDSILTRLDWLERAMKLLLQGRINDNERRIKENENRIKELKKSVKRKKKMSLTLWPFLPIKSKGVLPWPDSEQSGASFDFSSDFATTVKIGRSSAH